MNQHRKEGSRGSSLFLKIISFDLFFQGSEYGMSKCIASYLLFAYLFFHHQRSCAGAGGQR